MAKGSRAKEKEEKEEEDAVDARIKRERWSSDAGVTRRKTLQPQDARLPGSRDPRISRFERKGGACFGRWETRLRCAIPFDLRALKRGEQLASCSRVSSNVSVARNSLPRFFSSVILSDAPSAA